MIERGIAAFGYQFRLNWGWEGCAENQKITYFRYPKSKIINGKEATGLFLKIEADSDGTFNEELYNNIVSSFKFIE